MNQEEQTQANEREPEKSEAPRKRPRSKLPIWKILEVALQISLLALHLYDLLGRR